MKVAGWLLLAAQVAAAENYTYWIEPCDGETARKSACETGDAELGRWALAAWEHAARKSLTFAAAPQDRARIRVFWASGQMRLYGEARPVLVDGKRGAEIYVNPDVAQLGEEIRSAATRDRLLRDAIVYLTCLHESGHALGLSHTGLFDDIMYSFGYGGDIVEYFTRYRRSLAARDDIRHHSGISAYDRQRLISLFRKPPEPALR
jgi:hypothetical protein